MSRRKSTVVSPSPERTTSILRRSARLITSRKILDGDNEKLGGEEDLVSRSNPAPIPIPAEDEKLPPRKSRRPELGREVSKRLGGSMKKSTPFSSSCRSKSKIDDSSCTLRRSRRFVSGGGGSSVCQSSSDGKNVVVLGSCNMKVTLSEKMVESRDRNCRKSRSRVRPNSKLRACDGDEVSVSQNERKKMGISKLTYIDDENVECTDEKRPEIVLGLCSASSSEAVLKANKRKRVGKSLLDEKDRNCRRSRRNHVRPKSKVEDEVTVCAYYNEEENIVSRVSTNKKRPEIVLDLCSTGIASSSQPVLKANRRKRIGKNLLDERDRNCRRSRRNHVLPKSKGEDEVTVCAYYNEEENVVSRVILDSIVQCTNEKRPEKGLCSSKPVLKANRGKRIGKDMFGEREEEEERLKTKKNKPVKESKCETVNGWTKDQELALQRAYLTAKPSPNFWKKVSKMVHGKSAQECFDRMHKDLITPPQLQPRSRAKKTTPQFSLSASKPLTKPRQRGGSKNNLTKKTIRHLLEKQIHHPTDQSPGFDLFSVLEPNATTTTNNNNLYSTPIEKTKKILEFPSSSGSKLKPCSRFKTKTSLVSPPVLKQVKNKALHEKYIDQLHNRDAKRRVAAESSKPTGKENVVIRPIDVSVKAAKDAIYFDVQDAIQKLKSIESDENSSSSSEFYYGETDDEEYEY